MARTPGSTAGDLPRLLYVSPVSAGAPLGGRALLARLHRDCLAELAGDELFEYSLDPAQRSSVLAAVRGSIDGITPASSAAVLARIAADGIDAVWLDGSNLGQLARAIKRTHPTVQVIVFCHNVEARFFAGALRAAPSLRAAAVLAANWRAERLTVHHADVLIALSARDSVGLHRIYGRGADHILPMAMTDQICGAIGDNTPVGEAAPLLFAGGAFYANRAGIAWFARKVAPRIALRTQVVGRGMDALGTELATVPNIEMVGEVDALEPWYRGARAVIAPIFDGSGMKTKVAEALMHGKPVIGTPEAFSGYGAEVCEGNWVCETADEFVAAIRAIAVQQVKTLDPERRGLYQRNHSTDATRARIEKILRSAP